MNWINPGDEFPKPGEFVLVGVYLERNGYTVLQNAYFDVRRGWIIPAWRDMGAFEVMKWRRMTDDEKAIVKE